LGDDEKEDGPLQIAAKASKSTGKGAIKNSKSQPEPIQIKSGLGALETFE